MRKTAFLAVLSGFAAMASATTFTFTGTGPGISGIGVTFTDGSGTLTYNSVFAGQMHFLFGSTNLNTLCVSLRNTIGSGASWDTTTHIILPSEGNLFIAAKIMTANVGLVSTNDQWAGLQLAVWKAIYDGSNFSGTNFKVNSGASAGALANELAYFNAGVAAAGANAIHYSLSPDGHGQPQMTATPEPASLAVVSLGVLGLVRRRRKG